MKEDGVGIASIGEVLVEKRLRTGETGAWLHVVKDDTVRSYVSRISVFCPPFSYFVCIESVIFMFFPEESV